MLEWQSSGRSYSRQLLDSAKVGLNSSSSFTVLLVVRNTSPETTHECVSFYLYNWLCLLGSFEECAHLLWVNSIGPDLTSATQGMSSLSEPQCSSSLAPQCGNVGDREFLQEKNVQNHQ